MKTIEPFLALEWVQALGWTLVHALWQVTLVVLILLLIQPLLRRRRPGIRYGAALMAMMSIVLLSVITFLLYMGNGSGNSANTLGVASAALVEQSANNGLFSTISAFFSRHLPALLIVWTLGVLLLSVRFLGGRWLLHRLRAQARPVSDEWAGRLDRMCRKYELKSLVRMAESAKVQAPVLIGHLKPLILVPAGMLSAVPPEQIEAILAHELAHIRRNDFLVNQLQSIFEILYFFHPGVWWVNKVIRRERELCCDDMALHQCHPVTLAVALSEIGGWMQGHASGPALAFAGEKNQLLKRVKRLLGQEPAYSGNFLPTSIFAGVLVLLFLLSGAGRVFSSAADASNAEDQGVQERQEVSAADPAQDPGQLGTEAADLQGGGAPVSIVHTGNARLSTALADTVPEGENSGNSTEPGSMPKPSVPPAPEPPETADLPETPDFPPPPVAPALPKAPDLPPPPKAPKPPMPDQDSWEQFGKAMGNLGEAIGTYTGKMFAEGDGTGFPKDFHFKLDEDEMANFEKSMEKFGQEMELWGEQFGKEMEVWEKKNKPRMEQFEQDMEAWGKAFGKEMEAWAKKNEPKMKAFERKMKAWEKKNKPRLEKFEREMEEYSRKLEAQLENRKQKL